MLCRVFDNRLSNKMITNADGRLLICIASHFKKILYIVSEKCGIRHNRAAVPESIAADCVGTVESASGSSSPMTVQLKLYALARIIRPLSGEW